MNNPDTGPSSVPTAVMVEVLADDKVLVQEAERLQSQLNPCTEPSLVVSFSNNGVELRPPGVRAGSGFMVDFLRIERRTGTGNLSLKQQLPRAIGSCPRKVVDATAGFGRDAAMLGLMGYEVTALERSPVVAALLRDGLRRASRDEAFAVAMGGRLQVVEMCAMTWLEDHNEQIDTIFMDPMFPPKRKKSALPPGRVQLLQELVGPATDDDALLRTARSRARRVVVKRPHHAPSLTEEPTRCTTGKLVRYDIYEKGV
ncbi:MAG: class I SAM-dependent methyltransferase [Phycisphaerales bacterium]|nr:class I SAM-dependent methyltransferase [Phycisphaerales bacterium]